MKLLLSACLATSLAVSSFANVTKDQCESKGEEFIFSAGECIQTYEASGEVEGKLNIIVHGTWKEGTNTLGRYSTFADNVNMASDVTTVAVALPGYSDSSENVLKSIGNKEVKSRSTTKEYVEFMVTLVQDLKEKYNATNVTYIGHSAGASLGSAVVGYKPGIVNNLVAVGGSYGYTKKNPDRVTMMTNLENIDPATNIVLVYGTADKISKPEIHTKFYDFVKDKGLNVKLVKVEGAPHIDLDMTDPSVEAIVELNEAQ
jgi:predicted esterase